MSDVRRHPGFSTLASGFSGELVDPSHPRYDEARALFNAMIDARPALIAKCATPDDVARSIAFARDAGLSLAVRAGGHSVAGMSTVDDGLMIDLRPFKQIDVDPAARRARVGAGVTWGEFDRAAQVHGLATTGGRVSTTGVAGFTLGGGSGWLERKWGLACDSLVSVELVLCDGRRVTASEKEHPDLFWALHGGGGNFGVAVSFEFELHPVGPTVHAGLLAWSADRGEEVVPLYRDVAESAPEELGSGLIFLTAPAEPFIPERLQRTPLCAIAWCFTGPIERGEELIAPLRARKPDIDLVGPMPYAEFQCMIDDPPGKRNYWSAEYLAALNDAAIARFLEQSALMPKSFSQNILFPWGGAVARLGDGKSPMTRREAPWVFHPFGVWEGQVNDAAHIAWAKGASAAMREFATGGTYLNFIGNEGSDRVRAAFGDENYARLVEIKRQYDPENVFRRNQNIRP